MRQRYKMPIRKGGLDQRARHRPSQKQRGMKLVRLWIPDPSAPGFRRQVRRQARLLRGAPEEQDALAFIEAAADLRE